MAAISFLATLRMYVPALPSLLDGEKAAVIATLNEKFAEVEGRQPPAPSRTERTNSCKFTIASAGAKDASVESVGAPSKQQEEDALDELIPRVDLVAQVRFFGCEGML